MDKVTFHLLPMGGGFGRRLPGFFNFLDACRARRRWPLPGTPVKLIYTREQDMQHDYYRPNVTSRICARRSTATGMPIAWVNDYTTDDGANSEAHIVYGIDNQAYRTAKVETHIPVGSLAQRRGLVARLLRRVLRRRTGARCEEGSARVSPRAARDMRRAIWRLSISRLKRRAGERPCRPARAAASRCSRASARSSRMSPTSRSVAMARSRSIASSRPSMPAWRSIPTV